MDDLFANVFSELIDASEEQQALLDSLAPLMPDTAMALVDGEGAILATAPEGINDIPDQLLSRARRTAELVSARDDRGRWTYACYLEAPTVLVFRPADSQKISVPTPFLPRSAVIPCSSPCSAKRNRRLSWRKASCNGR